MAANNESDDDKLSNYLSKGLGAVQLRVVSGKRTLLQRKMANAFFKIVSEQGFDKPFYLTTQAKLARYSGFDSNDNKHLKMTASSMLDAKVEFDVMSSDKISTVGATNIFSSIAFRSDGTVYLEMPDLTKKMVSEDDRFALINMQIQAIIDGNYAYILYEHCLVYLATGETPVWSIDIWKEFLEVEEEHSTYKEFKFFNSKIIKIAVSEVNKVTDILIDPVFHKTGRVVTGLSFKVARKSQGMLDYFAIDESLSLQQRLVDFGISEDTASKLTREYARERIIANIEYTEKRLAAGKIDDNLAGFLIKAIEKDFSPKESELERKVREKAEAEKAKKEARKKEQDELAKESNLKIKTANEQAQIYFDNLTDDDRIDLMEYFAKNLAETNPQIFAMYKKGGLKNNLVKTELLKYIKVNKLKNEQ